jgi:DeoR/GlpR family transcriptional regulator of sugar metabolism
MVAQGGAARVADLAHRFDVDSSTIRRDLMALEERGAIRRVYGGAVAIESPPRTDLDLAADTAAARMGRAIADMVDEGETVFLGPGRLCLEVARGLSERSQLTVVTNGLEIAYWIASHTPHTVIATGGQVQGRDLGLAGELARASLTRLRADHVVLELGGVSAVGGITDDDLQQAEIARALLGTGSEIIALVPADRVGGVAAAYIAPASDVDVVVTSREAPSAHLWDLSELGVRVVLA